MQNFMWFAFGAGVLLVAIVLAFVLLRLTRTLAALEELLETANDEMRETLPELRGTVGNVNDLTAGLNMTLQVGAAGATRLGHRLSAAASGAGRGIRAGLHGAVIAGQSLAVSLNAKQTSPLPAAPRGRRAGGSGPGGSSAAAARGGRASGQ